MPTLSRRKTFLQSHGVYDPQSAPPAGIAFVGAGDGGNNYPTNDSSWTFSYAVGGGSNFLIASVYSFTSDLISSVTYNGVAMTLAAKVQGTTAINTSIWNYLYYLHSPATGAHNLVITGSGPTTLGGMLADYSGVNASGQPDATATNTNTSNSITSSVTTVADNSWAVMSYLSNAFTGSNTAGTGATLRISTALSGIYDSGGPITPAGSYSMTVNATNGGDETTVIGSFKP